MLTDSTDSQAAVNGSGGLRREYTVQEDTTIATRLLHLVYLTDWLTSQLAFEAPLIVLQSLFHSTAHSVQVS